MKHTNEHKLLNVAKGQLASVIKMTEDNRYCIDISNQISATIALLKKVQRNILTNHLNSCVLDAINNQDAKEKLSEIEALLKKII